MARISAQRVIDAILDHGSFTSWDGAPKHGNTDGAYHGTLPRVTEETGLDGAVITGEGTVGSEHITIVCSEFGFLGGSIDATTARRVIRSVRRATAEQLPLLLSPTSDDTHMQKGTTAFALVIFTTTAVAHHKDSHLPFLVYLRNPTTSDVVASWGSVGHFTFAEPGAPLDFLDPRVVELAADDPILEGVQTSENLFRQGITDGVILLEGLRDAVRHTIDMLAGGDPNGPTPPPAAAIDGRDIWEAILRTRDTSRPGGGDVIDILVDCFAPISGIDDGHKSLSVWAHPARIDKRPVILVAQDRHNQPPLDTHPMGPGPLRFVRRATRIAESLNTPLVTVIDTPGAELTKDTEGNAMAGEIVRTLTTLMDLKAPTMSLTLGQGCGGGALAMLPFNRVLAIHDVWMSPLPPEGASTVIYRGIECTPEIVEEQDVGAKVMLKTGVIDEIVAEPKDPVGLPRRALSAIEHTLWELEKNPARVDHEQRFDHYRHFALGE